ncbi:RNA methyltransferase [Alphaproteobacteria bacterium 46_93_T64]|nr:RNA methyltransferase [Alphaproteobacteria bacterium 46_93_T64]
MTNENELEILLVTIPGLEPPLFEEARERGFENLTRIKGGVVFNGSWEDVWRANLEMRGASRILVRLGSFHAVHLAQLDKRARRFPWRDFLRPDVPVRVEVMSRKSRIYHKKAAQERIERALTEEAGIPTSPDADISIKVRIFEDLCTISVDSSGEGLHIRGHKEALNKAPMRETLAALLLRRCGYRGQMPVIDPMCGSGTFVMEAAEITTELQPGRSRKFAFEKLVTFDEARWKNLKIDAPNKNSDFRFYGFDRDEGAIKRSRANAKRAGITHLTEFNRQTITELRPPEGPPGLVIINPPYGIRIGEAKKLYPLYQSLGNSLLGRFSGWRVGLVTNSSNLAEATGLPFTATATPFSHGGIRVNLYATTPLP